MFRDRGMLSLNTTMQDKTTGQVILSAILVNTLNPKLSIFFFAFLPQFLTPGQTSPIRQMLELSLVFMLLTFAVFALYGAFAAAVRRHVISSTPVQSWMRRGFAAAFAGLAAQLALAER